MDSPAKAGHLVRMAKAQGAKLTVTELIERGLPPYHDGEWLRQQLEAGYSFRQLAERYGYSPEAYRKAAKQLGLTSRFAKIKFTPQRRKPN